MGRLDRAFDILLTRVSPPPTQMEAARRSHNALRQYLLNDPYFGGMIHTTFLNGSYARNTVIRPIKDVDIIVVVARDWLSATPAAAMESLRRKLAQRYDQRRTLRQRRAVRVTLFDMQLDVLLGVTDGPEDRPLRIPDRNQDRWILTHPRMQLGLTSRLGQLTGGNYSRLVRLAKHWCNTRVAGRDQPSSFVLECATYHVIHSRPAAYAGALSNAFATLLGDLHEWDFGRAEKLFRWGSPQVPDPALPDVNVAERWSAASADRVRSRLDVAVRRRDEVGRCRWEETALAKWRSILGEPFPGATAVR